MASTDKATSRPRKKALIASIWAFGFWTAALLLESHGAKVLVGLPAYLATTIAVDAYCASRLNSEEPGIPNLVIWVLVAWAGFTLVVLNAAQLDPDTRGFRIFSFAKTHGGFVAFLFLWGILFAAVFFNKVRSPRATVFCASYIPTFNFAVFLLLAGIPNPLPASRELNFFYIVGSIVMSYVALIVAISGSAVFKRRH